MVVTYKFAPIEVCFWSNQAFFSPVNFSWLFFNFFYSFVVVVFFAGVVVFASVAAAAGAIATAFSLAVIFGTVGVSVGVSCLFLILTAYLFLIICVQNLRHSPSSLSTRALFRFFLSVLGPCV